MRGTPSCGGRSDRRHDLLVLQARGAREPGVLARLADVDDHQRGVVVVQELLLDAREVHAALLLTGAEPGSPVKFAPRFKAPTGTRIKVSLTYRAKGKVKTAPASEWVMNKVDGKNLAYDWVFAGSRLFKDPENPAATPFYMANNGEVISLSNFPDSMMDLPVKSSKDAADLIFEANTAKIPPLRSPVLVTLEPVVEKKK